MKKLLKNVICGIRALFTVKKSNVAAKKIN